MLELPASRCYRKTLALAHVLKLPPIQVAAKTALQLARNGKASVAMELLSFWEPVVSDQAASDMLVEAIPYFLANWLQQRDVDQLDSIMSYASYACVQQSRSFGHCVMDIQSVPAIGGHSPNKPRYVRTERSLPGVDFFKHL